LAATPAGPSASDRGKGVDLEGGIFVSIIRVGLGETKNFAEGYDAIFGKKKTAKKSPTKAKASTAKKSKKSKKK
jgi:hypothetical protein